MSNTEAAHTTNFLVGFYCAAFGGMIICDDPEKTAYKNGPKMNFIERVLMALHQKEKRP